MPVTRRLLSFAFLLAWAGFATTVVSAEQVRTWGCEIRDITAYLEQMAPRTDSAGRSEGAATEPIPIADSLPAGDAGCLSCHGDAGFLMGTVTPPPPRRLRMAVPQRPHGRIS